MAERKAISKKTRFEVFKRDSFTCAYCGKSAPSVILEIDHILPVSKGGKNEITNLITSCFDCNRGKSDIKLSDKTKIEKQKKQLDLLNERNNQLDMMKKWYKELSNIENKEMSMLKEYLNDNYDITLSEYGESSFKKDIKKFGLKIVIDAIKISFDRYCVDKEDISKALNKVSAIARNLLNPQPEHIKEIYYIRGIARNRWDYIDQTKFLIMCKEIYEILNETYTIKDFVLKSRNWSEFRNFHEEVIDGRI